MLYRPELGIYIPVLDFCARSRRVTTKKHGPQTSPDRDLYTLGMQNTRSKCKRSPFCTVCKRLHDTDSYSMCHQISLGDFLYTISYRM